jgi:hypothetical protein
MPFTNEDKVFSVKEGYINSWSFNTQYNMEPLSIIAIGATVGKASGKIVEKA